MTNESYWAAMEAEKALLGAILIESADGNSKTAIRESRRFVSPKDFTDYAMHDSIRSRFFYAMIYCENPPHQINLARQLNSMDLLKAGDIEEMSSLIATCPNCFLFEDYAKAVKEYSEQRHGKKAVHIRGAL